MQGLTSDLRLLLFNKTEEEPLTVEETESWLDYLALETPVNTNIELSEEELLKAIEDYLADEAKKKKLWNDFEERVIKPSLNAPREIVQMPRRTFRLPNWKQIAVIILFFAGGWYTYKYLTRQEIRNTSKTQAPTARNNFPPGTQAAQLTLSDGTFINLDSSTTNRSISDSGTTVTIPAHGKAVYTATGQSPFAHHTLSTQRGQAYSIQLSDGTKVTVNAESSLHYPTQFSDTARVVEVTGEAFFEVSKNSSRPFHVIARDMKISVTGTSFNVRAYPRDSSVQTTLQEGEVWVTTDKQSIVLKPGEQATSKNSTIEVKKADVELITAWKDGRIKLENQTIHSLMEQFRYWYNVDFRIHDSVQIEPKQADFDRNKRSLNNIIKVLEELYPHLSFTLSDSLIHVRKKRTY